VVRRALRRTPAPPGPVGRGSLASEAAAVHAATALFASVAIEGDGVARTRWLAAALHGLEQAGLPPPRGPGAGLAPALQPAHWRTALRVRRLSAMQRPLLIKCWVAACPTPLPDALATALHLSCLWLQVPQPPQLRARSVEPVSVAAG
jgi:hypothetical protein